MAPRVTALAELVRLPAVLSVPGDVLAGSAFAGTTPGAGRVAGLCLSSASLYLGGMALNDWADRGVDALERPARPIPSGRVDPGTALGISCALTGLGLGAAAVAGGRPALRTALSIGAAAWTYNLAAKSTRAGPAALAVARGLDVLLGSAAAPRPDRRRALPAAVLVAGHTAVTTALSRHEASGGPTSAGTGALAGTAAVTAAGTALAMRRAEQPLARAGALALLGAYALTVGGAQAAARRRPDPATMQRAVETGVLGLTLLEGGLLAASGATLRAGIVAGAWPFARALARRGAIT